jgi:hypothetical protein
MALIDLRSLFGPNNPGKKGTGVFTKGADDLFGNPGTTGDKTNEQAAASKYGLQNKKIKKYKG